eukprot:m.236743 g.236743  ORF g.236743 m.236743 type:complete len:85 (-) comp26551_c1_seq4:347-601(-)
MVKALELYRQALVAARAFPVVSVRRKLRYNIRELFELNRNVSGPERGRLLQEGEQHVQTLKELSLLDAPTKALLFGVPGRNLRC